MLLIDKYRFAIKEAKKLTEKIGRLQLCIDTLLNPLLTEALSQVDKGVLELLIKLLPEGYHRSEIRTHLNKLLGRKKSKLRGTLGRKTLTDLIEELKVTTNPVTYWAIKQCIVDRIDRKSFD